MPYVTVYYQGHKVEFVEGLGDVPNFYWLVEQNGESFKVSRILTETKGIYKYDLYSVGVNGKWRFQEQDIVSLDAVARVICDTVYV